MVTGTLLDRNYTEKNSSVNFVSLKLFMDGAVNERVCVGYTVSSAMINPFPDYI